MNKNLFWLIALLFTLLSALCRVQKTPLWKIRMRIGKFVMNII